MEKESNTSNTDEADNFISKDNKKCINEDNFIEKIIFNYGYKYNTWKVFFILIFLLISEGIHLTYFGNLIIPIKYYYNLSDNELSFHSSVIFVSLGVGAFSSGYVSNHFKRFNITIMGQLIIAILHIIIGLTGNIIIFSTARFIIGFIFGIIVPLNLNILTEYLPILYRAYIMILVWIGFGIGQCVFSLLMLLLMPNMETAKYPDIIIVSSCFSIISFIFSFIFLRDSPRHLILTGYFDEGIKILEELNKQVLDKEERERIKNQIDSGINNKIDSSFSEMFHYEFSKSTILLSIIQFINFLISYGTYLVFSLTIKELGSVNMTNNEIIVKQLYVNLINLLSYFLGGLLCENSFLGRIKAIILCSIVSIIFLILTIVYNNHFEILFGIFGAIFGTKLNTLITYVAELYPTKIRDLTTGYIFSCARAGAFFSQVIFIYLHNSGIWVPYFTAIALIIINIIFLLFLPYETYNKPLDVK